MWELRREFARGLRPFAPSKLKRPAAGHIDVDVLIMNLVKTRVLSSILHTPLCPS